MHQTQRSKDAGDENKIAGRSTKMSEETTNRQECEDTEENGAVERYQPRRY